MNPDDFDFYYYLNNRIDMVFINLKGFILKSFPLEEIEKGTVGVTCYIRSMSKMFKNMYIELKAARVSDLNYLEAIEFSLDLVFFDKTCPLNRSGKVKVNQIEIE